MIREVTYFESKGKENTPACVEIVKKLVAQGSRSVAVASTSGETGLAFAEALSSERVNLVVVTHSTGFKAPNEQEASKASLDRIRELGGKVFTGTILTHSLESALMQEHGGIYPAYIITQTLRRFSQGVKVAVEIVMEAVDAGLLPEGEEVIAVGGTGRGADTVLIVKSAASKRFFDLKVLEIVAKPRLG